MRSATSPRATRAGPNPRRRSLIAGLLALVAALVAGLILWGRHIGYPDGPIYRQVAATAPAQPPMRGTAAVFFSGDMGFNTGMGPEIAGRIVAQGIPVVGVNSLSAFAQRRTPQESAALVRDAVARALRQPGTRRVLLIGQSFGAGALLAGLEDLPATLRARIAMVALIVPPDSLLLQATPGGVFSFGDDGPALPAARRLDWVPVLCIHGEVEAGSLCPLWRQANVRRVALPGGHFLHRDAALVSATVLHAFATTAPAR